jgi:hypothetical protein
MLGILINQIGGDCALAFAGANIPRQRPKGFALTLICP